MHDGHFIVPRRAVLAALGASILPRGSGLVAAQEGWVLRPGIPVVLDEAELLPVRKAAADLCRDLEKVFRRPSPLQSTPPVEGLYLRISSGAGSVFSEALLEHGGPEAHALRAVKSGIELVGSDVRGAIYAVYAFSE